MNDKIIHERSRLLILTSLAGSESGSLSFTRLKESLELTSGNLSIQLKTLKNAGYVKITKKFVDDKPLTTAKITPQGTGALKRYLGEMEQLIKNLK
ncbi:MAG: ArsR family transcriptional regulator [Chitinivibrionales bacterium]|nr:ArsR family transcriptional regulator [Chitinivibrionales bacterium]